MCFFFPTQTRLPDEQPPSLQAPLVATCNGAYIRCKPLVCFAYLGVIQHHWSIALTQPTSCLSFQP